MTYDDEALLALFEGGVLPRDAFHHREHVRAAFLCLRKYGDFAEGAWHFRRALARVASQHGASDLLHETVTWAYLTLINEHLQDDGSSASSTAFVDAHPTLLDHTGGAFAQAYDVRSIMASTRARRAFLLPHRARA